MKIDLPSPEDTNKVISIEVARQRMVGYRAPSDPCSHLNVSVDRLEAKLVCKGCGKEVNAIEWIALLAEHWAHVDYLIQRHNESKVAYEAKKRCRCEHCHKLTAVKPATSAQIRQFKESNNA